MAPAALLRDFHAGADLATDGSTTARIYGLPVQTNATGARWVQVNVPIYQPAAAVFDDDLTGDVPTYRVEPQWRLAFDTAANTITTHAQAATLYTSVANQYVTIGQANEWRIRYANNIAADYFTSGAYDYGWVSGLNETPEQKAKRLLVAKNTIRRKEIAVIRAKRLMAEHLTNEELEQLAEKNYFEVASSSGRRYRIYRGHSRNVVELNAKGQEVNRLCAYSRTGSAMPDEDHMVIQKLMLLTDEAGYRKVANHSPIHVNEPQITVNVNVVAANAAIEAALAQLAAAA